MLLHGVVQEPENPRYRPISARFGDLERWTADLPDDEPEPKKKTKKRQYSNKQSRSGRSRKKVNAKEKVI